jgi:hypothetical protein
MADVNEMNKVIAEFMNYPESGKDKDPYYYAMKHAYENGNMRYHSDWSWLMPVVERIEGLGFYISINRNHCAISKDRFGASVLCETSSFATKMQTVFQCVHSFCQHYQRETHPQTNTQHP